MVARDIDPADIITDPILVRESNESGERRLLRRQLADGIDSALSGRPAISHHNPRTRATVNARRVAEDLAWVLDEDDPDEPFSFSWICHYLDIDAKVLRARVVEKRMEINNGRRIRTSHRRV